MDIGSILLGVALLLVVAFVVARPLLERAGTAADEAGPVDALLFERERVLTALRDLDFDHAMGKTLDDDYTAQREQLLAKGADVLRQLDSVSPGQAPAQSVDDEIERAVARLRQRGVVASTRRAADDEIEASVSQRRAATVPAGRFCSQCGHPAQPEDKFCGACGQPLPAAEMRPAKARR